MSAFPDSKLFLLQGYEEDFCTGTCADGRQAVLGLYEPQLLAYFFDMQGNMLGKERQPYQEPIQAGNDSAIYNDWQAMLGFSPGTIHIRGFFDSEEGIGIELIPEHLLPEAIAAEPDTEQRGFLKEDRAGWLESGNFVWLWGNDYWMTPEGEVEST